MQTAEALDNTVFLFWQRLVKLRFVHFKAIPGVDSMTQWKGVGDGSVQVWQKEKQCKLFETGTFLPKGASRPVPFTNTYDWQWLAADRLRLSHERFGAGGRVFLFDLVADGKQQLVSCQPHLCGQDVYQAKASMTEKGFALDWTITGPRKCEALFYQYNM